MSNFQPTVVIGIGGTGKNILLSLKKMIVENSPNGMKDFPVLKLFSLDTDEKTGTVRSELEAVRDEIRLDPHTEILKLGGDGITSTLDLDSFPEIKSWFPYSKRFQLNPVMLSGGASQMKPVGRFSFAWNVEAVRSKLEQLLRDAVPADLSKMYSIGESNLSPFTNVFICGSVCGGTGSGVFLDLAYLVRFIASQLGIVVKLYGMLALASVYDGIHGDLKLKPNCYASLMELDHFMNQKNFGSDYRRFYPAYRNSESAGWNYRDSANFPPFDYPYIFDKTNESGISFGSPGEFADMVARFVYLLTGSEVADRWQSMNNNVDPVVQKEESQLKHPIWYRSMGAFALLYPRRKIVQTCAYKFASEYFNIILDASYQNAELEPLLTEFLNDSKSNPDNDRLKDSFDLFRPDADSAGQSFKEFIESRKEDLLSELEDTEKKDLEDKVRQFKEDMDKEVLKFRSQNLARTKEIVKKFVVDLDNRLAAFVDLNYAEDTANPLMDGGKRMVRGSLVRAYDFTGLLLEKFRSAVEKFRREEDDSHARIRDIESDWSDKLGELSEAAGSFSPFSKGKIKEAFEAALDCVGDLMQAKADNLIVTWIRQFLNEVTENNIHIADGVLKEIEKRRLSLSNAVSKMRKLKGEVDEYIYKNKGGKTDNFCEVIFDYKTDVEGMYASLVEGDGLDRMLGNLSAALKDAEAFGEAYEKLGDMPESRILSLLIRKTEAPFFDPVSEVDISQRLVQTPDKLSNLKSGTYTANAKVYLTLNGVEMSKAGLSTRGKEFFAIMIPNEAEYDRFCKNLVRAESGKPFSCPFEEGGSRVGEDEVCPLHGKCLKTTILKGATSDLTLIPSENKSEINILKTVAGFPLRAVTTVAGPYREAYRKAILDQEKENETNRIQEEVLHMFGPLKFDDLDELAKEPVDLEDGFRKTLLLALALRRLSVERLSVKFLTQADLKAGRDTPSLELGSSFADVLHLAQSARSSDMDKVRDVTAAVGYDLASLSESQLFGLLKACYDENISHLPEGMTDRDIAVLDSLAAEHCSGKHIVKESRIPDAAARLFDSSSISNSQGVESGNDELEMKLGKLKSLFDKGLISQEDFDKKKSELLAEL